MPEDAYLKLTLRERVELLDEISRRRNLAPAILEKDYWVCRTLDTLFSLPGFGDHLVFKGGTSLSKVFGLIDRFSEDVDISFHRDFLGFGDDMQNPETAGSNKQQRARIEALQAARVTAAELAAWWKARCGHLGWKTRNEIRGSLVGFWKWCVWTAFHRQMVAPAGRLPRAELRTAITGWNPVRCLEQAKQTVLGIPPAPTCPLPSPL